MTSTKWQYVVEINSIRGVNINADESNVRIKCDVNNNKYFSSFAKDDHKWNAKCQLICNKQPNVLEFAVYYIQYWTDVLRGSYIFKLSPSFNSYLNVNKQYTINLEYNQSIEFECLCKKILLSNEEECKLLTYGYVNGIEKTNKLYCYIEQGIKDIIFAYITFDEAERKPINGRWQ